MMQALMEESGGGQKVSICTTTKELYLRLQDLARAGRRVLVAGSRLCLA